jgi:hypothetical protein
VGAILLASAAIGATATNAGHGYVEAAVPGWELTAHILLSMGAAALLFAAAVTAVLLVFLDRRLRTRRIADLPSVLPPLDALEKVMFRQIGAGFVLLTLSLFTGFVFVTNLFTQHLIHKTVLSLIAWTIFGVLLIGRIRVGWRGRTAVSWTLGGFGALALAYFGAKVLHPKTLRPVLPAGIPVWIRNSFAPERLGTKITQKGKSIGGGVKALTAIRDVALISLGGPGIVGVPDVIGRTFTTTAELRADVLLISQSSSQNDICFLVSKPHAHATVDALRKEFAQDLAHEVVDHITVDPNVAIVAVVGENMRGTPGVAGRTFNALGQEKLNLIAIAQGSSETNISFVVDDKSMQAALRVLHREFGLGHSPTS